MSPGTTFAAAESSNRASRQNWCSNDDQFCSEMHNSLFEVASYGVETRKHCNIQEIVFIKTLCFASVRKLLPYAHTTAQTSSLLSSGVLLHVWEQRPLIHTPEKDA